MSTLKDTPVFKPGDMVRVSSSYMVEIWGIRNRIATIIGPAPDYPHTMNIYELKFDQRGFVPPYWHVDYLEFVESDFVRWAREVRSRKKRKK